MKKAKIISFESIQNRTASDGRNRSSRKKQVPPKMRFRDHVLLFISEGLELILFPFILLFNLIKETGKTIFSLFRK